MAYNPNAGQENAEKYIERREPLFSPWQRDMLYYMLLHDTKKLVKLANDLGGHKVKTHADAMRRIIDHLASPEKTNYTTRKWLQQELKIGIMWPSVEAGD